MNRILLMMVLLALPLTLSACSNCIDSGICPFVNEGPPAPLGPILTIDTAWGSSTEVALTFGLDGIAPSTPLELILRPGQGSALDPAVLATADDGRVVVRRTSATFTGPHTSVMVTVAPDATPATDQQLLNGSFQVRQAGTVGVPGNVGLIIRVR